jgi:phosphate transport system substrate-binding protein
VRLIKRVSPIVGAVVVAGVLSTSASAATSLTGAGSSLVAPLVAEWAAAFQAVDGTSVNYISNGSQAGLTDVVGGAVDFAATDAPMTPAQWAACGGCYQIPISLSSVAVGYHVQGLRRSLYLTGNLLAQIYLGRISRWNDPRIKALNPRASLPNLRITPIYSGGSGATYAFTLFLSKTDAMWRSRIGYGLSVAFPTGTSVTSASAETVELESTNGAIGYIGASYLIANRLPAAAIQNSAGRFEYPNLSEIERAGRTVKHIPLTNALEIVDPPRTATIAYPIATYTYLVAPTNAPHKADLQRWMSYVLGLGQSFGPTLDFAPLPPNVLQASRSSVNRFIGSP